jgi:hypothetical protein
MWRWKYRVRAFNCTITFDTFAILAGILPWWMDVLRVQYYEAYPENSLIHGFWSLFNAVSHKGPLTGSRGGGTERWRHHFRSIAAQMWKCRSRDFLSCGFYTNTVFYGQPYRKPMWPIWITYRIFCTNPDTTGTRSRDLSGQISSKTVRLTTSLQQTAHRQFHVANRKFHVTYLNCLSEYSVLHIRISVSLKHGHMTSSAIYSR